MGILATLRERIMSTPDEPNVVVSDDEFDALIAELKDRARQVYSPEARFLCGRKKPLSKKTIERIATGIRKFWGSSKPMTLYGRLVVAPDGSPRTTKMPKPDKPFDAPAGTDWGNSSKFLG